MDRRSFLGRAGLAFVAAPGLAGEAEPILPAAEPSAEPLHESFALG